MIVQRAAVFANGESMGRMLVQLDLEGFVPSDPGLMPDVIAGRFVHIPDGTRFEFDLADAKQLIFGTDQVLYSFEMNADDRFVAHRVH